MNRVQRFRFPWLKGMVLERRPVSKTPDEGVLVFVDQGTPDRTGPSFIPALYVKGEWIGPNRRPIAFEPTFWTVTIDEPAR